VVTTDIQTLWLPLRFGVSGSDRNSQAFTFSASAQARSARPSCHFRTNRISLRWRPLIRLSNHRDLSKPFFKFPSLRSGRPASSATKRLGQGNTTLTILQDSSHKRSYKEAHQLVPDDRGRLTNGIEMELVSWGIAGADAGVSGSRTTLIQRVVCIPFTIENTKFFQVS
jgi:hypothetical protein